jgi:hypothetical protein
MAHIKRIIAEGSVMPIIEEIEVETAAGERLLLLRHAPFEDDFRHSQLITSSGLMADELARGLYRIYLRDGTSRFAIDFDSPPDMLDFQPERRRHAD